MISTLVACGPSSTQPGSMSTAPAASEEAIGDEAEDAESSAEPGETPPPASGVSAEMQTMLELHNQVRARHCAKPLTWSPQLAASAQAWANKLRDSNCAFEHSQTRHGENLAGGTAGMSDARGPFALWADEEAQYDYKRPGFAMETGHFTQVVWRGTTQLGCGRSTCTNGRMDIWVCHYDPAGNYEGQYPANVLPRGCR